MWPLLGSWASGSGGFPAEAVWAAGGEALPGRASSQGAGELHRGHCRGGGVPTPSQDHQPLIPHPTLGDPGQAFVWAKTTPLHCAQALLWLAHCREQGSWAEGTFHPPCSSGGRAGSLSLSWFLPAWSKARRLREIRGENCPPKTPAQVLPGPLPAPDPVRASPVPSSSPTPVPSAAISPPTVGSRAWKRRLSKLLGGDKHPQPFLE